MIEFNEISIVGLFSIAAILIQWLVFTKWLKKEQSLRECAESRYVTLLSQKKSSEVRLGQISEHLAPFTDSFKHDPKKAHFLGNPIDYVVFEDDKIVFVEVKSGESKLSTSQKNIKKLISDGKVEFEQVTIK